MQTFSDKNFLQNADHNIEVTRQTLQEGNALIFKMVIKEKAKD